MMDSWQLPQGFRFSGVACGVRGDNGRKDVALMVSDVNAAAAGVFTTNRVNPLRFMFARKSCLPIPFVVWLFARVMQMHVPVSRDLQMPGK